MEEVRKKQKMLHRSYLKNKKLRSRFKTCLGNNLYKQVPYEIWQQILRSCSLQTTCTMAKLCKAFEEFVEEYRRSNFGIALGYRREGQLTLARKHLHIFAKNGNQEAMFHLAIAYRETRWGIPTNQKKGQRWLKKLNDLKHPAGMIYYAKTLSRHSVQEVALIHSIAQEALALDTCKNFERGVCHYEGLGVPQDIDMALTLLEISAEEDNNEFAQCMMARHYDITNPPRLDKMLYYILKASNHDQGYKQAQFLYNRGN